MNEYDEIAAEVDLAAVEFPRMSPAARRFAAGEMCAVEARQLGYVRATGDDPPVCDDSECVHCRGPR